LDAVGERGVPSASRRVMDQQILKGEFESPADTAVTEE
jgi:hypothetical protein